LIDKKMPDRDNLNDRLTDLAVKLAVAESREAQLESEIDTIREEVNVLNDVVSRGRGALLLLVGIGSVLGAVVGLWDKIIKFFGGGAH
jgi:hypothetical protein